MRQHVSINSVCLKMGLIPTVLEIYSRETNGFLIGTKNDRKMRVISAYTMQTDNKKPTYVTHGNISALRRLYGVMDVMNWNVVGGFHSHPDGPNKLSWDDKHYIKEKMEENGLKEWLEILLSVRKRDYIRSQKNKWIIYKNGKKIDMKIITDNYTGFDVTISGYWLKQNNGMPKVVKEATLWSPKYFNG